MRKNFFLLLTIALAFYSCSTTPATPPAAIMPIPTQQQVEWQKMEQYAFVHFGLNTFNDLEWGFGDTPAKTFNPTNLNIDQWIETIKAAGLKAVILTAKHHDGFCLWPSKYNEYNIKNSLWKDGKGDMVRELIEACKRHNLKVGLYLSPWDRNHAEYGNEKYQEYFQNQISELINEYCNDVELFEYWFDGANGGDGYYGGAREKRNIDSKTYYKYQDCVDVIHKKFPNAMIFGGTSPTIRWIGNESGWAGETNWAMWDNEDSINGLMWGNEFGAEWLPGEVDVSIRPGWFYHKNEDHQVQSLSSLIDIYYNSVGRNANLLLNFPVSLEGTIHPIDSARVIEFWNTIQAELKDNLLADAKVKVSNDRGVGYKASAINDDNWDSYWATEDGVASADVTFSFNKPTTLNRVLLQEYIPLGQRVKSFSIEYQDGGKWISVPTTDTMTTIGYKRIIRFENITASKLRINIKDARGALTINNIEAFLAPALLVEPTITRDKFEMVRIKGGDKMSKIYYTTDGSEPTSNSELYNKPFEFVKGTIKAIAIDPSSPDNVSPISTKSFDIFTTPFKSDAKYFENMFDANAYTNAQMPTDKNEVLITLNKKYTIKGFTYTPNQTHWGGGIISRYELWSGGKKIISGEFSNIKANPIEQVIMFDKPIESSELRFVAKSLADGGNGRAEIAEFTIITE